MVLLLARYYVIEDLLLEKGYIERGEAQFADLTIRSGTVNTDLLDYLKQQKAELERELSYSKLGPEVAVAGLQADNWLKSIKYNEYRKGSLVTWKR